LETQWLGSGKKTNKTVEKKILTSLKGIDCMNLFFKDSSVGKNYIVRKSLEKFLFSVKIIQK